jgi:hypothetical protein
VTMPGLRRATASLAAAYHGQAADLEGEVLTGFLAALRALDLDDLDRVPLASRLCWAAWRAGRAAACADAALIGRNRLEHVPLARIAAETGISHTALCRRTAGAWVLLSSRRW